MLVEENNHMKFKFPAIALALAVFAVPFSRADSACQAGTLSTLIAGGACTIGNTLFTFTSESGGDVTINPESSADSAGFNISGFAGTTYNGQEQDAYFTGDFTAVPISGTITSTEVSLNGVSQNGNLQFSGATIYDGTTYGYDQYFLFNGPTYESTLTGGSVPSFGGDFELTNSSPYVGSTSFQSADFVFDESDPDPTSVPEGSELGMLGIAAAGMLGAMKKRFQS
jgi:hypothetical protein